MNYRNPQFNAFGTIDCEIEHPVYGWVPFTCDPNDTGAEFDTFALFAAMHPHAAPYVPPSAADLLEEERANMVASRMQARIALHQAGLLTQIEQAVAQADPVVQIAWQDATIFERNSPTIAALAEPLGLTPEQLDDLFRNAMTIKA